MFVVLTIATPVRSVNSWCKPPGSFIKINYNVSIRGNDFIEIGFVLCDSSGKVIGAGVNRILGNLSVDCAKALTVYKTILFAMELGINSIIVETDCLRVIQRLVSPWVEYSYLALIIDDCSDLRDHFALMRFMHVGCNANTVAYGLTKLAQIESLVFLTF